MKKTVLLMAALLCLFSSSIKAQTEGDKQNYVKLQFVQPLGEYKDFNNSGFGAEFGRMFPLNIDVADGLILPGIDITFISTQFNTGKDYTYFNYTDALNVTSTFSSRAGLLWNLGVKLGPMITIGITDGLVADFAIQYDPTVVFYFRKGVDSYMWNSSQTVKEKTASSVSFAHRIGIKGDIRYERFLFGLEFVLGGTTLHYNHDIIPYKTSTSTVKFMDETTLGLGTLLLNFGLSF